MNTYNTFIFFAFILLFSSSSLAYHIYPYSYEQYQESNPAPEMMMVVPTKLGFTRSKYVLPSLYQVPDRK